MQCYKVLNGLIVLHTCISLATAGYTENTGGNGKSQIIDLVVIDSKGNNTCIADLDCFLNTNEDVTLKFDLEIEKEPTDNTFTVTIDQIDASTPILNEVLKLCQAQGNIITLENKCKKYDKIKPGSYQVLATIHVPFYKDMASLTITGPDGAEGYRNIMSYHSSRPPLQLCNPKNWAC